MKITITMIILFYTLFSYSQTNKELIQSQIEKYEIEIDSNKVYNSKTLNLLFNKKLESYVTSVDVPSLKSLSAVLDNDDNSFSFGYSFDPRNGKGTDYLQLLAYIGLKMKGKEEDKFYTIIESDKARNNIGIEFKGTWFYPGSIWTNNKKSPKKDIAKNRISKIRQKLVEEFENKTDLDSNIIVDFITKEEVDYILKENKYNSFIKAWITFRTYYPVTNNEYDFVDNSADFNKTQPEFTNWDISLSLNFFIHFSNSNSFTFSVIPKVFNNNNILTKSISSTTFTTFQNINNNQPVQTSSENLYVGEYDEFITNQLKAEFTSFFLFDGRVGLSCAVEKNYGTNYNPTNWKLGLPVNLKNSKGESDINFEIQWKEINKKHYVGISVGKTFGKFVK